MPQSNDTTAPVRPPEAVGSAVAAAPPIAVRYVPIESLVPDPKNPRHMPDEEMAALTRSLQTFGFVDPAIVRRSDRLVIGGHQRVEAARRLGWHEVPVVEIDVTDDQAHALNVALNRIHGEFDIPKLAELLASLPSDLAALTGFDEAEMRRVARDADLAIRALAEGTLDDDAAPPLPEVAVTKPGDLIVLGAHRLLCGDATKPDDVARLMNGEKAALFATDPPYLVDYQGGNHPQSWSNSPDVRDKHWDDYRDPETGVAFYEGFLRAALTHCADGVAVYQWFATKRHALVEDAWRRVGLLPHQELVWVKSRPVLTHSHFMWQSEPAMYGWLEGHPPRSKPPASESNVWTIEQKGEGPALHPTQKPVEVFARPIRFHTLPGEVCLEPFCGSGSQVVAAERLGRRCFAMEIEPKFVDVAVARWCTLTGRAADVKVTSALDVTRRGWPPPMDAQ